MPFRVNAKSFSLTYAQAGAIPSVQVLFDHLCSLRNAEKVVVGQEHHEDGGIHYHACVQFARKYDCRNERFFDFMDCHPNVQATRVVSDWVAYCIKDGTYLLKGFTLQQQSLVETIHEIVDAGTDNPVAAVVRRCGDRALAKIIQIDRYVSLIQKPNTVHEPLLEFPANFVTHEDWLTAVINFYTTILQRSTFRNQNTKSLWLYGPSRKGKTTLARSLGIHWYMQGMWNADQLDATAEYGVMDDIPWEYMKINYKGMLGFQKDVTVTDKYRKKVVYPGGIGVIVCSNELPYFTPEEQEWLDANVVFARVFQAVYVLPPARVADGAS